MSMMNVFKENIVNSLVVRTKLAKEEVNKLIEIPSNSTFGDFAFPCFHLSKDFKKSPNEIAKILSEELAITGIEKIENVNAYINFFIDKDYFIDMVLNTILKSGKDFGRSDIGKDKTIIIDYSSVNIAKPFHIGHLRSTSIGNSLYKIYSFLGYSCVGINHLGDWGTQFGKLIVAYNKWADNKKDISIKELVNLYVRFHSEAEQNEALNDEAREVFKKLELGDDYCVNLWKFFKNISLKEFERVYSLLGVEFDSYDGESYFNDKIDNVISELEKKNLIRESNGAKIVDLELDDDTPPCLVKRSDGASLYATRDLAAILYRKKKYNFSKILYVVGNTQKLHFRQIFRVIELMGFDFAKDLYHVDFGTVKLKDGAMSTRKGIVVYLEDVLNESILKVRDIIKDRDVKESEKYDLAKKIGIGAVIYTSLSSNRQSDTTFLWEKVLNFEGDSSPYIQYTNVRIKSIIEKANINSFENVNYLLLKEDAEIDLIKYLSIFPEKIKEAANFNDPSIVAKYVLDIAKKFNKFYSASQVLKSDIEIRKSRVALCKASSLVIEKALSLLGIQSPDKM